VVVAVGGDPFDHRAFDCHRAQHGQYGRQRARLRSAPRSRTRAPISWSCQTTTAAEATISMSASTPTSAGATDLGNRSEDEDRGADTFHASVAYSSTRPRRNSMPWVLMAAIMSTGKRTGDQAARSRQPAGCTPFGHRRAAAARLIPPTRATTGSRGLQGTVAAFVQSGDTLYLHSKEGQGSSAGLVTALAMALCDAAEQLAKCSPGGRLAVPLVGVLDEAANICRWRQLPDLHSHYGSRGIPLLTLLQSGSQGAQVWGQTGMHKLWGASKVSVYGGGSAEEEFLSDPQKLIGEYNRLVASPSSQRAPVGGSTSTSWQLTPTPILTVADLAALPRDRIIVMPSGAPPVLAEPTYWWNTRKVAKIRQSIATYDPPAVIPRRHTRARAAHRVRRPQGARPSHARAARRRADRATRRAGGGAATRRARRPARPLLPDPRGVVLPSMRPLMSDSWATLAAGGSRRYPLRFTRSPFMSLASVPVLIFFLAFRRHFAEGLT
jgi:TraM recognition site of TraD and TraG